MAIKVTSEMNELQAQLAGDCCKAVKLDKSAADNDALVSYTIAHEENVNVVFAVVDIVFSENEGNLFYRTRKWGEPSVATNEMTHYSQLIAELGRLFEEANPR